MKVFCRKKIKDSEIILLDEPTSNVDPAVEMTIFKRLFEHLSGRSVISVLHRLHLVRNFDYVRAQVVKVLNRLFKRGPLYAVEVPTFTDVPLTHWAFHEIEEAAQEHQWILNEDGNEELQKNN
ncbi:hypothetical protein ACSVDA_19415 [Cytobacillus sp. Hm23]